MLIGLLAAAACSGSGGPPVGPPAPEVETTRTIQGRIGYRQLGPELSVRDEHGRLIPQPGISGATFNVPVVNALIELLGDDGRIVGTATPDSNGRYSVVANFGLNPPTPVRVRVTAEVKLPFGTTVRVYPDAASLFPYVYTSLPQGDPGTRRNTIMTADADIEVADGAGAFHMLKVLYNGFLIGRTGLPAGTRPPDMNILWKPGNGDESILVPTTGRAILTVAGGILGDDTSNTDVWDNAVLMRLHGEYMLAYYLWDVAPEGSVTDCPLVPSAAWKEGFLDFWSCLGRNSRVYWDTVGSGAGARVTRYFDIESFFDDSLPRIGTNDPNVYQPAGLLGINSRFSIAELLWDLHDNDDGTTENDFVELPPSITLKILNDVPPGFSYPYLFTLLRGYEATLTLNETAIELITRDPEDQGFDYPASVENGTVWPAPVSPNGQPGFSIRPPEDITVGDTVDTTLQGAETSDIADTAQRYFLLDLLIGANVGLELITTGDLVVDVLTQANALVASGPTPLGLVNLPGGGYILRVRAADGAEPQVSDFQLRVQVSDP